MTVRICSILARGGSKGLPGKNLRALGGRPLLAHAIEQARAANMFDAIAVSSDSAEILAAATTLGVKHVIRRPDEMATDAASKLPAIQHCMIETEKQIGATCDIHVDLGVTTPLRTADDIRATIAVQEKHGVSLAVSATEAHNTPYFNIVEKNQDGYIRLCSPLTPALQRRQDGPRCYTINGAIYVWRRDALIDDPRVFYLDTMICEMPPERSIDIDSAFDFDLAEFLWARRPATPSTI